MPSLTLPDRLIWFAHCPKAGGTSVEHLMVATWGEAVGHLHWGWDLWWKRGGWRHASPPNSPQHLTWDEAQPFLARAPSAVFAVVRDPVARMVSEYRWQTSGRRGTWAGRALAHLPFALWLEIMLAMARRNPHAFDNHLRPQGDFIPEGAVVFRLEDGLQPVADWLGEVAGAGRALTIPHALKAQARALTVGAGSRARIARAFAGDYARFGYARPETRPGNKPSRYLAGALVWPLLWLERRGLL